jgi:hypothetical protein
MSFIQKILIQIFNKNKYKKNKINHFFNKESPLDVQRYNGHQFPINQSNKRYN